MSTSRRGKSAAVVPPTSWSKGSSQAARATLPGKTRRSASPIPWARGELSKLRSPFEEQSDKGAIEAASVHQNATTRSFNDEQASEESYESDGNLSIPGSFTRSAAALNIGNDFDQDDENNSSFFALPSFESQSASLGSKQGSRHIGPLSPPSHGQSVSESWDEDFVFSREATQDDVKEQGKNEKGVDLDEDSSSDSFDEESRWDSDENKRGAVELLSGGKSSRVAGVDGKGNRLYKASSSQTITAQDRDVDAPPARAMQQGRKRSSSPMKSAGSTTPVVQSPFPLASSPARIPSRLESLQKRSAGSLPRQPTTPSSAQIEPTRRNHVRESPKSIESPSSSKQGLFGVKGKASDPVAHGNTPEKKAAGVPSSQKRTSLGRMEAHWSKMFSSRIGRRKDSDSSGLHAEYNQRSSVSEKKDGKEEATLSLLRRTTLSKASNVSIGTTGAQVRPRLTVQTSSSKAVHNGPKTASEPAQTPASGSRPVVSDRSPSTSETPTPRTLPRKKGADDSGYERRHWASMLDDADRPSRSSRAELSSSARGAGKRKASDADGMRATDAQTPQPATVGLPTRSAGQASSATERPPHVPSARSASRSTTASGGRTSSAGSSMSTAPTIDSVPAAGQLNELASSFTVRRTRLSSTASKDGDDPTSSTDSRYMLSLRSSTPKKPPPVSSGLHNLARRKPSLSQLSPASDVVSPTDQLFASQLGTSDSSVQRAAARRNSLGDLKIPTRIIKVQDGVRADMARIRTFASGIEELKGLREAYQRALDRFDDRVSEGRNPVADELKRSRYTYESWWECAEVLIGLADGKEALDAASTEDTGELFAPPLVSPASSTQSPFLTSQHQQGSVRRHGHQTSSSRASSTASRYMHPEREKEILAAMLAGTPPVVTASPPLAGGRRAMQRERTISTEAQVWRSPSAPSIPHRRESSQRPLLDGRRVSDSKKDDQPGQGLEIDVALANGSPKRRLTRKSGIPMPTSSKQGTTGSDLLGVDAAIQGSGGRRRLRSAGQLGLQSLRDLVTTLRSNTTLRPRPVVQGSGMPPRSRTSSRDSSAARRHAVLEDAMRTVRLSSSPLAPFVAPVVDRPLLHRAAATAPTIRRGSRVASVSSNKSSELHGSHHESKDVSLDSDWTEADPDSFFGSSNGVPDTSTTSHGSEAAEAGRTTPSSAVSRASAARPSTGNSLMGMMNGSAASLVRLRRGDAGTVKGRSDVRVNIPAPPSATSRTPHNAQLPAPIDARDPGNALRDTAAGAAPPTISRQRSPSMTEQTSSTDSSNWSARCGRMRVMSADHVDVAEAHRNQATSNAFRELAMRPEAIPSLNRYLEATRAQCRECLSVMKQLEALLTPPARLLPMEGTGSAL